MTRWVLSALWCSCAASAHVIPFDFVAPSAGATRTVNGSTSLQWVDGNDPQGLASLRFFATRNGFSPFERPALEVAIGSSEVPVNDPLNVLAWSTSAVPPGCYRPFAQLTDQLEGVTLRPADGLVTVGPNDAGNQPPSVWVLNAQNEQLGADGRLALRLRVDDPDDTTELTLRWSDGADARGTLASGLPIADGGGTVTYPVDPRFLPPASGYYLQAEVTSFDGQRCSVWWAGSLPGREPPDAGPVSALDAGVADGGGEAPLALRGCGCATSDGALLMAVTLLLRRPAHPERSRRARSVQKRRATSAPPCRPAVPRQRAQPSDCTRAIASGTECLVIVASARATPLAAEVMRSTKGLRLAPK